MLAIFKFNPPFNLIIERELEREPVMLVATQCS